MFKNSVFKAPDSYWILCVLNTSLKRNSEFSFCGYCIKFCFSLWNSRNRKSTHHCHLGQLNSLMFPLSQETLRDSVVLWAVNFGLIQLTFVVLQVLWGIKALIYLSHEEIVSIKYLLIVLTRLIGLIDVQNIHFRQASFFDRKLTWLLIEVVVVFPNVDCVSLKTGSFLCSKCSLYPPIKQIFYHLNLIRIPYCLRNTSVDISRFDLFV